MEILILNKIGIVHYSSPAGTIAGVEVVIDWHCKILTNLGYPVKLITGTKAKLNYRNLEEVTISSLSPNHSVVQRVQKELLQKHQPTKTFIELKNSLKKHFKETFKDLDVCIVHNMPSMPFNFAATAAINELADESNLKFIFWLHDTILVRDEWKTQVASFPMTLLHHKNHRISFVTPTQFRANQFTSLEKPYKISNMKVISNGVSVENYLKIDVGTKQLLSRLNLSFNDYIIVTPVRILPRKNIELALNVLHELIHLSGNKKKITLLITGPPSSDLESQAYVESLNEIIKKHRIQDNVFFCHDLISFKREIVDDKIVKWSVADAYNIAELVFIPSKEEGFGLPIIEAGAARKPIFCSRIPPFQELIREEIEGHLFDLNDSPMDIAFRIFKMMIGSCVDNNFDQVIEKYDWNSIVTKKILPLLQ